MMDNWDVMDMEDSWLQPFEEGWASTSSPTLHPVTTQNSKLEECDEENKSNLFPRQSKLSRKQLASKWLKELEQSHLDDEPFSGWLGEKMDLEVFRDVDSLTYPSTILMDDESNYSFPLTAPSSPESNASHSPVGLSPPESPSISNSGFVMIPVDNQNLLANFEQLLQSVEEQGLEDATKHDEAQYLPTPPLSPPLQQDKKETLFDVLLEGEVCCFQDESQDTSFIDHLIEEAVSPVSSAQSAYSSPALSLSTLNIADVTPISLFGEENCSSSSSVASPSSPSSSSSSDEEFVVTSNKRGKTVRKTAAQRGVANGGVAKRSSASGTKRLPEDRKLRKKEQNKTAATRYRLKKKAEVEELLSQETELVKTNEALKKKFEDLSSEVRYLKKLMREMFTAKGLMS